MTEDTLREKIRAIERDAESKKIEALKEYADANNPYKIGDIVSDHRGMVKIERIRYSFGWGTACCVYHGTELKKDLTPMKKQSGRGFHQTNILKK